MGSNPTGGMDVSCECLVLSSRGLCDEMITRPEKSHRLWCVVVCDLENLKNEEAMTRVGSQRHMKKEKCIMLNNVAYRLLLFKFGYGVTRIICGSTCLVVSVLNWYLKFPRLGPHCHQRHCFRHDLLV
jgi:hypothetical protein